MTVLSPSCKRVHRMTINHTSACLLPRFEGMHARDIITAKLCHDELSCRPNELDQCRSNIMSNVSTIPSKVRCMSGAGCALLSRMQCTFDCTITHMRGLCSQGPMQMRHNRWTLQRQSDAALSLNPALRIHLHHLPQQQETSKMRQSMTQTSQQMFRMQYPNLMLR